MGTLKHLTKHPAGTAIAVTLGIIAHDGKKDELAIFARAHHRTLQSLRLIAPEDTARALAEVGIEAQSLAPDSLGGDLQLAASVVDGMIDAIVFLQDPLVPLAGEPDVRTMLKVCDLQRVPMATNVTTAEILVHHLASVRGMLDSFESEPSPALDGMRVLRLGGPRAGGGARRRRVR